LLFFLPLPLPPIVLPVFVKKKKKKNGRRDFGASKALRRKGDGAMSRRSIPAL
jgi:hypothetical protein